MFQKVNRDMAFKVWLFKTYFETQLLQNYDFVLFLKVSSRALETYNDRNYTITFMQQAYWTQHYVSNAILRRTSHAGLNFPRMQFKPTVRYIIKWMEYRGSNTALRMVHLWTLSHRFSLKGDFISLHHHKLHSWVVVQLPG